MKNKIHTLLSLAALITLAFATPNAAAQEVPSWAAKNIDKLLQIIPDLSDDQKMAIVEAMKARGAAIKEAEQSGAEGEDIKAQTKEAWSVYVKRMREILGSNQFEKFDEQRMKEAGQAAE